MQDLCSYRYSDGDYCDKSVKKGDKYCSIHFRWIIEGFNPIFLKKESIVSLDDIQINWNKEKIKIPVRM